MIALKLTQVGNSVGVVLPKEALAKLGVERGDGRRLVAKQADAARAVLAVAAGRRDIDEIGAWIRARSVAAPSPPAPAGA